MPGFHDKENIKTASIINRNDDVWLRDLFRKLSKVTY